MILDDILELAAAHTPSPLERARDQRNRRRLLAQFEQARSENRSAVGDHDVRDPLAAGADEVTGILRAAHAAQAGTITWYAEPDRLSWSDEMSAMLGYPPGTVAVSLRLITAAVHEDDLPPLQRVLRDAWHTSAPADLAVRVHRQDGSLRYLDCFVEILTRDDYRPRGVIVTARDITADECARHERELRLRREEIGRAERARTVPGTRVLDREPFLDEIDIQAQTGRGGLLTLTAGGRVASTILEHITGPDDCGMLGPDEYGVLLRDHHPEAARAAAEDVLRRLAEHLGPLRGGLVTFDRPAPAHGRDLLQDARFAQQRSHADGVTLTVLAAPRDSRARDDLHRAGLLGDLAAGRLRLYSQKIRDVRLREITRHEFLLRVLDEGGRPQPPVPFLEIAEHLGETLAVDTWVIDHAFEVIGRGPRTVHHQINLSARSLSRAGLVDMIDEALRRHGVDPSIITFEVTESAAIDNLTAAVRFAEDLTSLGCRLAIDDFGAGHASLRLLKYLPVDLVKIDGEFVAGLPGSPFNQVVVRSVVRMCQELGIRTAAEHVRDAETLTLLGEYGVDFAQGYAIAEPEPIPTRDTVPLRSDPRCEPAAPAPETLLKRAAG